MYLDLNDTITEYGLDSLLPIDLDNLVNQMLKIYLVLYLTEAFIGFIYLYTCLFKRNYYKSSFQNYNFCDSKCRFNIICGLKQARFDNFIPCV